METFPLTTPSDCWMEMIKQLIEHDLVSKQELIGFAMSLQPQDEFIRVETDTQLKQTAIWKSNVHGNRIGLQTLKCVSHYNGDVHWDNQHKLVREYNRQYVLDKALSAGTGYHPPIVHLYKLKTV